MVLPNQQFENLEIAQNSRQSRIFYHEIGMSYLIIYLTMLKSNLFTLKEGGNKKSEERNI